MTTGEDYLIKVFASAAMATVRRPDGGSGGDSYVFCEPARPAPPNER